ncbi:ion transporter [Arenibaculum pallidiluteum]|uniref:ion transporter n=1 Tax=Arenibaculum pallidiluteum TaxID=2812559 RepID=UPI001A979DF3|nr:ion transporter [Arenibaculum pallidiluteum]
MIDASATPAQDSTSRLRQFLESERVQNGLVALIVVNAVTLGLATSKSVEAAIGPALDAIDNVILGIFAVELVLKLIAYRPSFFKSGWNVFDFVVVGVSLMPSSGPLSALRALRVLRLLRMISIVPSMRMVIDAMFRALPGMGSIAALLVLIVYVGAVLGTNLFGEIAPEFFGTLGASMFTLFQIMTVEGWPDIARGVMEDMPWAWLFFVVFLLLATFTVLNLFIGIIVSSMEELHEEQKSAKEAAKKAKADGELMALTNRIGELERQIAGLTAAIRERG